MEKNNALQSAHVKSQYVQERNLESAVEKDSGSNGDEEIKLKQD